MAILRAENLKKAYKGRTAVENVSFHVGSGEVVGILGPNGAGKTTSFYMVIGLVKSDSGRILLDDYDLTPFAMYKRARFGIGYLPQESSIFRGLSVGDNIRAVLELVEKNKAMREQIIDDLLSEFKILHLKNSPSLALSGGERRRLEIARALALRPKFLLLDEPFAGIDPLAVSDIKLLVRHLAKRSIGVLITDHNVRETLSLVDRAYIMHEGQELAHGKGPELVENAQVRRFYLGEDFRL